MKEIPIWAAQAFAEGQAMKLGRLRKKLVQAKERLSAFKVEVYMLERDIRILLGREVPQAPPPTEEATSLPEVTKADRAAAAALATAIEDGYDWPSSEGIAFWVATGDPQAAPRRWYIMALHFARHREEDIIKAAARGRK